jgi:hypothetical protein
MVAIVVTGSFLEYPRRGLDRKLRIEVLACWMYTEKMKDLIAEQLERIQARLDGIETELRTFLQALFSALKGRLLLGAIPAPPLALGLPPQGVKGEGFAVEGFHRHAPACADAAPLLDKQHAAEQIRLHVEPIEAVHVAGRVDAAKMHGVHGASLAIVIGSNEYPLDLVERHFFGAAVVKLRRAGRGMIRHLRGAFERAAVLQISGNARRPERVIADLRGDACAATACARR